MSCLKFTADGFLLSAGKESVLVQWHLEKQDRTFISRLGNGEIVNLSLSSGQFYSCVFADNSIKICRFDNNKAVVSASNLKIGEAAIQQVSSGGE